MCKSFTYNTRRDLICERDCKKLQHTGIFKLFKEPASRLMLLIGSELHLQRFVLPLILNREKKGIFSYTISACDGTTIGLLVLPWGKSRLIDTDSRKGSSTEVDDVNDKERTTTTTYNK